VPILRPYRTREDIGHWWQDPSVIPYLESRLALKVHKGIGEFHLFGGQTGTPVIKRLIEIVLRENIYLHAHSDEVAIVELFTIEPRLKVIWAHAGMSSGPQAVGALLDRYPNLSVDLAIRNGTWPPGGVLDPGWRAVFLRHPDRFLAGTDTWVTSRWEALPGSVSEVRTYLRQLPTRRRREDRLQERGAVVPLAVIGPSTAAAARPASISRARCRIPPCLEREATMGRGRASAASCRRWSRPTRARWCASRSPWTLPTRRKRSRWSSSGGGGFPC
jgi:hypothetical protein